MTHTHLIGIGGTGLSAIARVLIERGENVSGSDSQSSPLFESIREAGAKVTIGHAAENVAGADLVLRSSAIPDDNVEVQAALEAGIPVVKRNDYFIDFLSEHQTIGVAGSHGKTTTSAMITWMLSHLGLEPGFIVGGDVENLGINASAGNSSLFVIEADEYDYMFWGLRPEIAVVTNIEHDHPDCFPNKEIYFEAFKGYIDRVKKDGLLTACLDDSGAKILMDFAEEQGKRILSYSLENSKADYYSKNYLAIPNKGYQFEVYKGTDKLTKLSLQVPGKHNILNALAALIVADQLGQDLDTAAIALGKFIGAGRRFDVLGEVNGIIIIDDYGHHPTEIKATLAAAKARYPDRRLWAIWQPHTFSRTFELLEEFGKAFKEADQVLLTKVYASREKQPPTFKPGNLVSAIHHPQVQYRAEHAEASKFLLENLKEQDVVIVFSAGDATEISASVFQSLKQGEQKNV